MSAKLDGKVIFDFNGKNWIFPLPDQISYSTSYGWEKADFGIVGSFIAKAGLGGQLSGDLATAAATAQWMQTNAFGIGDIMSQKNQKAVNTVNPKEAILFRGVSPREYSLEFLLADRTAAGVKAKIRDVNEMQKYVAPDVTDGDYFFTYPETGEMSITEGSKDIFKPRRVAVTSLSVNLAPDGFYATWTDGTPLSFRVNVGVMEMELPTQENDTDVIGSA